MNIRTVTNCALVWLLAASPALSEQPVCFEAEAVDEVSAPMRTVSAENSSAETVAVAQQASGGAYLEVPEGAGKPPDVTTAAATLSFTLPESGTYYLWARAWWTDQCGNSVAMSIDGGKPFMFGQDATYKCWHWVKAPPRLKQLDLEAGKHTLRLDNREDGIRIDQLLLVRNRRYVPVDIEEVTWKPDPDKP